MTQAQAAQLVLPDRVALGPRRPPSTHQHGPDASGTGWAFGNSLAMREVDEMIRRVAPTDISVLVWGDSGVGKEVVAWRLHELSPRRGLPFVKVNCAALPGELLESELFGYERGAFTGAHREKPGKFELANTGTIFLDEIGELPLALQAKLLQVLQDHQFSRLGSRQDIRVDVRVITATNKNLHDLVTRGGFRADLYYRLNVVNIHVPPLRERPEEIPILVDRFVRQYAEQYGRPRGDISAETLGLFMDYRWPGNIREVENLIKRIVVLGSEDWVAEELATRGQQTEEPFPATSLPPRAVAPGPWSDVDRVPPSGMGLKEIARTAARGAERVALAHVLDEVRWNRMEAARRLKISYKALLQKIKRYGLA